MATKSAPSTKFAFDSNKPLKTGFLNKQGAKISHKFKKRFFVLYPGFLVYYEEDQKWRFDITVGGLGSRSGAIKLKGGECNPAVPHGVPKECHYGIVLKCPDPSNKRSAYLLDASSDEDRQSWVEAIQGAIKK